MIQVYRAAIFDLDDTLIRIEKKHKYAVAENILNHLGVDTTKIEDFENICEKVWFETDRKPIIEGIFGVSYEAFWKAYSKFDTPRMRELTAEPYADAEILRDLKQREYKTGIVTLSPKSIADMELEMLRKRFGDVVDNMIIARGDEGYERKPDPEGLYVCMDNLGVKPEESVYIGNSEEDIIMANAAGVLDIFVDRGTYDFDGLEPSIRITNLYELRHEFEI